MISCTWVKIWRIEPVLIEALCKNWKPTLHCQESLLFFFLFFFSLIDKEEKRIYQNPVNHLNPNFWRSQSCFLSSNWLFDCKRLFIDKQVIITDPAVPLRTRLLNLNSKLFPGNIQRALNKTLTRLCIASVLKYAKIEQANKRTFLLAGSGKPF